MKHYIFILFFSISAVVVSAQQIATSSMYDLQGSFHNPSVAGVQKHGVVGASYRAMWDGIDGGPRTATVFGSGYIPSIKLGLGGYVYSDVTGPTKRTGLQMAYAYHISMKNDAVFSLGIEGRFQQFSFDRAKLQASLGNDPVIGSTNNKVTYIQRLLTAGGLAPAEGADEAHLGRLDSIPYTARYLFYEAGQ
jgi:type IX secretion system PorP/SprF family membrane protein